MDYEETKAKFHGICERLKSDGGAGTWIIGQVEFVSHLHFHICVHFPANWRFNRLREWFVTKHNLKVNLSMPSNLVKCAQYCSKNETRFTAAGASGHEWISITDQWWADVIGTKKPGAQGKRTDLDACNAYIQDLAKDGKSMGAILQAVSVNHGKVFIQYSAGVKAVAALAIQANQPKFVVPEYSELFSWQRKFVDFFTDERNREDRLIFVYVGETGNEGKSMCASYMREKHDWVNLYGDYKTMAYVLSKEHAGRGVKGITVDLTRAEAGKDIHAIANFLERCKSGHIISEKYESLQLVMHRPHVVIFCNEIPPGIKEPMMHDDGKSRYLFSGDRVRVVNVYRDTPVHAAAKRTRDEGFDEVE